MSPSHKSCFAEQAPGEILTSTLLQQELHTPLVFLLLLRKPAICVELSAIEGVF